MWVKEFEEWEKVIRDYGANIFACNNGYFAYMPYNHQTVVGYYYNMRGFINITRLNSIKCHS